MVEDKHDITISLLLLFGYSIYSVPLFILSMQCGVH